MLKEWFEEHYELVRALLLVLAALNGWMAYLIFPEHPFMALANAAMAVAILLGVVVFWRAGEPG